jgi:hypothetical protein
MNTGEKNSKGRTIFRGPRGGEYVLGPGGSKIRSFKRATAPVAPVAWGLAGFTKTRFISRTAGSPPVYIKNSSKRFWAVRSHTEKWAIPKSHLVTNIRSGVVKSIENHLKNGPAIGTPEASSISGNMARMLQVGNKFVSKRGNVYNRRGLLLHSHYINSHTRNAIVKNAYNKDPRYLYKYEIPLVSNGNAPTRSRAMTNGTMVHGRFNDRMRAKVFFNRRGNLLFVTLNGRSFPITDPASVHSRLKSFRQSPENARRLKRMIGAANDRFPRAAIPPAPVQPTRSSPALLENMMNQIYIGGRGSNINATRYTPAERDKLARRLSESINAFKRMRNQKKQEATHQKTLSRNQALSTPNRARARNAAAAANERVGYYDDAIRAYTRGLRAVKPLTGNVPASARRMAATPNRWTPAPAGENFNAVLFPIEGPHLVVKTPGLGTIYLTPNSFRGLVRNAARVNIAPNNTRDWLRMARRNFPNEPLFRHPVNRSRNVLPTHIRFSR